MAASGAGLCSGVGVTADCVPFCRSAVILELQKLDHGILQESWDDDDVKLPIQTVIFIKGGIC